MPALRVRIGASGENNRWGQAPKSRRRPTGRGHLNISEINDTCIRRPHQERDGTGHGRTTASEGRMGQATEREGPRIDRHQRQAWRAGIALCVGAVTGGRADERPRGSAGGAARPWQRG